MGKLTPKQQRFVDAYTGVSCGNATDAARRAGYSGSAKVLQVSGARLLSNAMVRAAIKSAAKRSGMEAAEVLKRVADLARLSVDVYDPLKPLIWLGKYHGLWNRHERQLRNRYVSAIEKKLEGKREEFSLADFVADAEKIAEARKKERQS